MKTYKITIVLDDEGVGVHEKVDEGLNIIEARLIHSVLMEYSERLLDYIVKGQQQIDLSKQTKQ